MLKYLDLAETSEAEANKNYDKIRLTPHKILFNYLFLMGSR